MGQVMRKEGLVEEVGPERWVGPPQVRRRGRAERADRTGVAGAPWGWGGRETELRREGGLEKQGDTMLCRESSRGF